MGPKLRCHSHHRRRGPRRRRLLSEGALLRLALLFAARLSLLFALIFAASAPCPPLATPSGWVARHAEGAGLSSWFAAVGSCAHALTAQGGPQPLALHAACFSFELHDVLLAFCDDKIIALATSKKAKLLLDLKSRLPDTFKYALEVLTRDKTDKDKVIRAATAAPLDLPPERAN